MAEQGLSDGGRQSQPLFSIGHSNHPLERFLELLDLHAIKVLADIRSQPYSKYVSQFNAEHLRSAVEQHGKRYLFLGQELGGRPEGDQYYDDEDRVLYSRVARSRSFLDGLERLTKGMRKYRIAMMCSEEDPSVCHRHLLVGRVLVERGIVLNHIRGDGRIETQAEVESSAKAATTDLQLSLFPEPEVDRWRSLRSVSRKEPRPTSSER